MEKMFRRFLRVKGSRFKGLFVETLGVESRSKVLPVAIGPLEWVTGSPAFGLPPLLAAGDDGSALFPPHYIKVREMKGDVKTGHHLSVKGTVRFPKFFLIFTASFAPCFQF